MGSVQFGSADSYVVRVHWHKDTKVLSEDSFCFHSSFAILGTNWAKPSSYPQ